MPSNIDYVTRNAAIVEMAAQSPAPGLADIGREFGITYERVRQILKRQGFKKVPHGHEHAMAAAKCRCGNRKSVNALRCRACTRAPRVVGPCAECGAEVRRKLSEVINNMRSTGKSTSHLFCNRTCQGRRLGKRNKRS